MNRAVSTRYTRFWETGRTICAIGRNYVAHAKELGNAVPTSPVLFLKPVSSYVRQPNPILCPPSVTTLHHEVELGVIIKEKVREISPEKAMSAVGGYCLALDMTARNLQDDAKSKGLPWTVAKGYDTFCPIGDFIPRDRIPDPSNVDLWLKVDGQYRQRGNTSLMIFKIPNLISYISSIMTLDEGDLILTGTPEGVGPVKPGQKITAGLSVGGQELSVIEFPVIAREYSKL